MDTLNARGLVLIGCGFMGQALLEGWLAAGVAPEAVTIQDPTPSVRRQRLWFQIGLFAKRGFVAHRNH